MIVLAVCAFTAISIGAAVGLSTARRTPVMPHLAGVAAISSPASPVPPSPRLSASAIPTPPVAAPKAPAAPSFDIVRVAPDGSAVLAGRATPGTSVTVQESGRIVGEAQADARGAWVMVPDAKLPPGAAELTLTSKAPGAAAMLAEAPVVVVVPPAPSASQPAQAAPPVLALLTPPAAPSRLLQAPADPTPGRKLGLGTVDYDEHGAIRFSGTAPPDAPVRAYVDNSAVGDARADPSGHWAMSPPQELPPGLHELRLDQLTPQGQVASRVELPFKREDLAAALVKDGQVVVQPGQNLWRLARRAYGAGIRYTVIFLANRDQIRDARLIYPGQVFSTPGAVTPVSTP